MAEHDYTATVTWTGNRGAGTPHYRAYDRNWEVRTPGKPVIQCSNDPLLGGDPTLHNPEDLLISALASCHMLWFLHLASDAGIIVLAYEDTPLARGETQPDGTGRFLQATLRPLITVADGADLSVADDLHHKISEKCYIARSVNFPVSYQARYQVQEASAQ
ncbi:MAG: OsmC family protein [Roseovarius sp.]